MRRVIEEDTVHLMDGDQKVLSIQEIVDAGCVRINISGAMRSDTAHDVKDELMALTALGMDMSVDLSGVESICATSQHVLLQVQQKIDELGRGNLVLTKLSDAVNAELEKTGLSELLMIE